MKNLTVARIVKKFMSEETWGKLEAKKLLPETTTGKIFEKSSSFKMKLHTTGKVQFLFSRGYLLVLANFLFWGGDWALGYNSMKFCYYSELF